MGPQWCRCPVPLRRYVITRFDQNQSQDSSLVRVLLKYHKHIIDATTLSQLPHTSGDRGATAEERRGAVQLNGCNYAGNRNETEQAGGGQSESAQCSKPKTFPN